MEQKWLANGSAVLVLDAGNGEPNDDRGNANPDYRPALVAVLATEYHEPAQILDADPLAEVDTAAATTAAGATQTAIVPGEVRGAPAPAPQAIPGPATPAVSTRSTAAEDPNVTAPGSAAAVGSVPASQIIATVRDLEARADAGDADAQAELAELQAAFEEDDADADDAPAAATADTTTADVPAAPVDPAATPQGGADSPQADTPETAPGGNGTAAGSADAAPASATGAGEGPAAV